MYELTSPSVTVVRSGRLADLSACAVIAAIFCFSCVASRRDLLTHVEHLIDGVVRLADIGVRLLLEIAQRLHPIFQLGFIGRRLGRELSQLLHEAVAILLRLPA